MINKHLELIKKDGAHVIKINSLTGRVSLFTDHPRYKLKDALNFTERYFKAGPNLSVVPTSKKDVYILEETDSQFNRYQHFVYADLDVARSLPAQKINHWLKLHFLEFFNNSLAVAYIACYIVLHFTYIQFNSTTGVLSFLRHLTGSLTLAFALLYYHFKSSKSKSSFLKFCFSLEFIVLVIYGTANNIYLLNEPPDLLSMDGY